MHYIAKKEIRDFFGFFLFYRIINFTRNSNNYLYDLVKTKQYHKNQTNKYIITLLVNKV